METEKFDEKAQFANVINMINNIQNLNQEQHSALLDKIDHLSELVETKMNNLRDTQELKTDQLTRRVLKLEDIVQKVTWILVSAIILAVLGLVVYPPKF